MYSRLESVHPSAPHGPQLSRFARDLVAAHPLLAHAIDKKCVDSLGEYRAVWGLSHASNRKELLFAQHQVRTAVAAVVSPERSRHETLHIDIMCSDGRLDPCRVLGNPALMHEVFAVPGSVILPPQLRARGLKTNELLHTSLHYVPEWEGEVFRLFEQRWGAMITKALKQGEKVSINLFSHLDTANPKVAGCGAHKCHTEEAQLETAMNEAVLEYWLRKRFPDHLASIKVNRLAYDTHDGSPQVLDAKVIDNRFRCAARVNHILSSPQDADSRLLTSQPQGANPMAHAPDHNEQGIRISNKPQFHNMLGVSTFSLAWQDTAEDTCNQVALLLGIARRNFLTRHPNHPIILHLDLPVGDARVLKLAKELPGLVKKHPELSAMKIEFFFTETDGETGQSHEVALA